jgi:hypothetical protein
MRVTNSTPVLFPACDSSYGVVGKQQPAEEAQGWPVEGELFLDNSVLSDSGQRFMK